MEQNRCRISIVTYIGYTHNAIYQLTLKHTRDKTTKTLRAPVTLGHTVRCDSFHVHSRP